MNFIYLFIGAFVGGLIYQYVRDFLMLKKFRVTTPESAKLARNLVVSHTTNVIDALFIAIIITAIGVWLS